jgi:hypothetical protein
MLNIRYPVAVFLFSCVFFASAQTSTPIGVEIGVKGKLLELRSPETRIYTGFFRLLLVEGLHRRDDLGHRFNSCYNPT